MKPSDSSLESPYDASDYSSSLESPLPTTAQSPVNAVPPPANRSKFRQSLFRYDRRALVVTVISLASIGLVGWLIILLTGFHSGKQNTNLSSQQVSSSYAVGSSLSIEKLNSTGQLQVSEANQLTVNGNLDVTKSLILTPGATPTSPVTGQIYYSQTSNSPYYYNGSQFVSLTPGSVTSIGGSAGVIALGNGLSVNGSTLSISSSLIQTAGSGTSRVSSLQGLTGDITLSAGSGIAISGTTITNSGVVGLTSHDGSITITQNNDGSYDIVTSSSLSLPQPLAVTDSPTFAGLTLTGGTLTLNGGSNGDLIIQAANPHTSGNVTVGFPTDLDGGTSDVFCLKNDDNCGTSTKTVTYSGSGGTANTIPIFDSAGTISNSGLTDNGSILGITDATEIQGTGSLSIVSGGNLSVGSSSEALSLIGSSSASTYLKVFSGSYYSELNFASVSANQTITIPNNNGFNGTVCLEYSSTCGFATPDSVVTSLNNQTGSVSIADVQSAVNGLITIQNASTSVPGLVQIDSDGNLVFNSGLLDTAQSITTSSSPTFENLTLNGTSGSNGTLTLDTIQNNSASSNLTINGGTGGLSIVSGGITFSFPTSGNAGQTICTTGVSCASGGGEAVILGPSGIQTDTSTLDSVAILKNSNTGNILNLQAQNSSTSNVVQNALVINNSGNATFGYGSSSLVTAQNLTLNYALTTNSIVPKTGGTLAIGTGTSPFTLQGNSSSYITSNNGAGANTKLVFDYGALSGNSAPATGTVTYYFANDSTVGTNTAYEICTTDGNCSGTGGSLTGAGTVDDVAYFSTSNNLVSTSMITLNTGSNSVNFGSTVNVQSGNALVLGTSNSSNGGITFNNSSNSNTLSLTSGATGAPLTLILPTSGGTSGQCLTTSGGSSAALSFENCITGGSGGGSVSAVNTLTGSVSGPALSGAVDIADAISSSGTNTITIQNASTSVPGLVQIDSDGNLVFNSGLLDTAQSITTSSSPTFAGLTVQGINSLTVGGNGYAGDILLGEATNGYTDLLTQNTLSGDQQIDIPYNSSCTTGSPCTLPVTVASSGNLTISANGALNTVSAPTFSGLVTAGSFSGVGSSLTSLSGGNITNSTVPDTALVNPSVTINSGTNLTGGNTVSLGGTLTISTVNNPSFSGGVTTNALDNSGSLSIGTTNATSITIGKSSYQVSFPGGITSAASIQGASFDASTATGLTIGGSTATSITLGKSGVGTTVAGSLALNSTSFSASSLGEVCYNTSTYALTGCTNTYETSSGTNFIQNQYATQQSANFDITSASGQVAAKIQGAASQDIEDLYGSGSSTAVVASFNSLGNLSLGNTSTAGKLLLTDGTSDGYEISLSTATLTAGASVLLPYTSTAGDNICLKTLANCTTNEDTSSSYTANAVARFSAANVLGPSSIYDNGSGKVTIGDATASSSLFAVGSSNQLTVSSAGNLSTSGVIQGSSFDANSAAALSIGATNATSIILGQGGVSTTVAGTLNTQSISLADGAYLTINNSGGSGATGYLADYYVNNGGYGQYDNISNSNTTGTQSTVSGSEIVLSSSGGTNTTNGIYLYNVSGASGTNIFNGLYLGTGFSNAIQSAGALNLTGNATSTWDLGASNTLNLQTTNNGAITTGTGLVTTGGSLTVDQNLNADNNLTVGQSSHTTGNLLFADSSNNYTVTLADSTAATASYSLTLPSTAPSSGQCLTTTSTTQLAFGNCFVSHSKQITRTAEYDGAVLDSAGDASCASANIGTMTSGYNDSDSSPETYYQWSTTQTSAQCYDVVVQIAIPSDWASWGSAPTIYASAGTGGSIAVAAIAANGTEETNYGTETSGVAAYHSETTTGSLAAVTLQALTGSGSTDYAGGVLTLKIRMSATSSGNTQIGTIVIPYNTAY